jgi:hypothetical protein
MCPASSASGVPSHEVSHVIMAAEFADAAPPLWVDEGIAVLAEKASTKHEHQRKLEQFYEQGTWFSVEELMTMKEYPAEELRGLFYAQSVSLVDFLLGYKNGLQLVEFVRSSERKGYEMERRRIYGFSSFSHLDELWSRHVRSAIANRDGHHVPSREPARGAAGSESPPQQVIASTVVDVQ